MGNLKMTMDDDDSFFCSTEIKLFVLNVVEMEAARAGREQR